MWSTIDRDCDLEGASTHLSVESNDDLNDQLCLAYTATYAPGLMLLLDGLDSPGLLVRPRPGRTELCGEFARGAQLRAAALYAAGSVLAAARDLAANAWAGPAPVRVAIEPARRRFGWFVSRRAFGPDLYESGRDTRLRRSNGGVVCAQSQLEWGWARARRVLEPFVDGIDLVEVDDIIGGAARLPLERAVCDRTCATAPSVALSAAPIGLATSPRVRDGFDVRLHVATWDVAIFQLARGEDKAVAVIPAPALTAFLDSLDGGELDALVHAYFDERDVQLPRLVVRASDTSQAGLHDAVRRSAALMPEDRMGVGPGAVDPLRRVSESS